MGKHFIDTGSSLPSSAEKPKMGARAQTSSPEALSIKGGWKGQMDSRPSSSEKMSAEGPKNVKLSDTGRSKNTTFG